MSRHHAGLAGWALVLVFVWAAFLAGAHASSAEGLAATLAAADTAPAHGPTCDEPSPTPAAPSRTTTRCAGPELAGTTALLGVTQMIGSPSTGVLPPAGLAAARPRLTLLGVDRN